MLGGIAACVIGLVAIKLVAAFVPDPPAPEPRFSLADLNYTYAESVKNQVRSMMKNPHSVMFRDVRVVRGYQGKPTVCGYVNATNAYGGYAGESRFVTAFDMVYILARDNPNVEGLQAWNDHCQ